MDYKFSLLGELPGLDNAHLQGIKQVFMTSEETNSALTQFAYGVMEPGQQSGDHIHSTMDEYFYFITGSGTCAIAEEIIQLEPSGFLRIPAAVKHNLINNGSEKLVFIYFGIAV